MTKFVWVLGLAAAGSAYAQLAGSAYRVLGQPDLRRNGLNIVQGTELKSPGSMALDARGGKLHIYVADTGNSRILAWENAESYQIGEPPAVILGQPGPQYTAPNGIGAKGFGGVVGIAVDPTTGSLYAADTANNRILRFPAPFANPNRVEPDMVYGQPNFTSNAAATTSSGLNQPRGVAFDSAGNLWVADTGNHRVVRYPAGALNSAAQPAADMVIGQNDLSSGAANAGAGVSASGFDTPAALAFDAQDNLYVADFRNTRVLRFSAPLRPSSTKPAASAVWGEINFAARGVPPQAAASTMAGPVGLAPDSAGNLYVAVPGDNRVLVFPISVTTGAAATSVFGQTDFATTTANSGASPLASASSLAQPVDVKVWGEDVYVVDNGNHRVLRFASRAKSATLVWGQTDFTGNTANQLKPGSINYPYEIAIDYSSSPFALYVADTGNHRILVWKDAVRYRSGDPADLVIGQPNLRTGVPNVDSPGGIKPTQTSLFAPEGIAVNPYDGTLYVADTGNNRVLRYPRPVAQGGRITPDAVIGQPDFTVADSAMVSAGSLKNPGGVAIGPTGSLFVADSGNNRVLQYAQGAGNGASAMRVFGQPSMMSGVKATVPSAQTLANPQGIAVDSAGNLYVADTGASRVIIFPDTGNAPPSGTPATFVLGPRDFATAGQSLFKTPTDVAVDSAGKIYVSDQGNNRVLIFDSLVFLPVAGASPSGVVGQQAANGSSPNWDSGDSQATAAGLYGPAGVYVDRQDTLYVGDAGNNRVLQFLRPATVVNAATYQTSVPVGQGSLATLFGSGLASDTRAASGAPWPTAIMNRQVVFNDEIIAPLYFAGPGQMNFQTPTNAPLGAGRVALRVADTGELVAGGPVLVGASSPGIFTANQSGSGQAVALNQNGTVNGPSNPAAVGSTIVLYGTGQGQVSPAVPDGVAAPASPLAQTVAAPTSNGTACLNTQPSMCVALGATGFGGIQYSGLAPGFIGLWQINVTIPQGTPAGNALPLRVVIDGRPSNTVTVAVR